MNISIRKEKSSDIQRIHELTIAAFLEAPQADKNLQRLYRPMGYTR